MSQPPAAAWIVLAYRVPSSPSTARVAAWRALRDLGALSLGPAVCVLPAPLAADRRYEEAVRRIREAGGTADQLVVDAFAADTEAQLRDRHNAARDEQYADVARRATRLVRGIEADLRRGHAGFDELERHELEFARVRRSLRKVAAGDFFSARGHLAARAAVDQAAAAVDSFGRAAGERGDRAGVQSPAGDQDRAAS
jgi:hypothetical protein